MASNCVDQNLIELIARNAVMKLIQDHTLQPGLKSCDCNWLGGEVRIPTCDALPSIINEFIEGGELDLPTPTRVDVTAGGELVITLSDGSAISGDLSAYVRSAIEAWSAETFPCGPFTHVITDDTLTGNGTECAPLSVVLPEQDCCATGEVDATAATAPSTTEDSELPTTLYGGRTAMLGAPVGWINVGGLRVPHYGAV